ncbi:MAG: hypothetical protein ACPG1A_17750 [Halioglobus sp.]
MKYLKSIASVTGLCALVLTGCAQQPGRDTAHCSLSGTNNVERLFEEASDKLHDSACHYHYPEYRARLVAAAKGSPGPENEARFAGLVRESIDLGVVSKRQGQEMFSQYFDPEFYAVKSEARSSCTSLRQREQLDTLMRKELEYKREGMLEMLGDEQRFRQAQHYYSDLHVIFDAVEAACVTEV